LYSYGTRQQGPRIWTRRDSGTMSGRPSKYSGLAGPSTKRKEDEKARKAKALQKGQESSGGGDDEDD